MREIDRNLSVSGSETTGRACCRGRDCAVGVGIAAVVTEIVLSSPQACSREVRENGAGTYGRAWTSDGPFSVSFFGGGGVPRAAGLSAWKPASGRVAAREGLIPFGFLARLLYLSSNSVLGGMPHRGEGISAAAYSGCWFRRAGEGEAGYESGLEGLDCGRESWLWGLERGEK